MHVDEVMDNTTPAWTLPPTSEKLKGKGRVATLGMFIIDHFRVATTRDECAPDEEAIGGGGVYAMTAARMFLPPTHGGLIVDRGDDFPESFTEQLETMGRGMVYFRPREGKTTRALNSYSGTKIGEGTQSFEYLTPRIKLSPKDLVLPPSPFTETLPEWIHVVSTTERIREIADELDDIRREGIDGIAKGWHAKLVWEPLSPSCTYTGLEAILKVLPRIAVFSPNLLEMQSILSLPDRETVQDVEKAAHAFADLARNQCNTLDTAIIVRAGALGSYTLAPDWTGWVPAYWSHEQQDQVIDVTGGGNAWMGGLCAGLLLTDGDYHAASIFASTSASFAIQQRGLPSLKIDGNHETWNGDDPWRRLSVMARKTLAQS